MIAGSLEIQLRADMARLARDMDSARKSVGGAMASIEKAVESAKAALGGLGGGIGLSQIISLTDQYTKFTAQLKLAASTTSEYATAYADVQRIAKSAQADLASTGVLYARIAQGTRELGLAQTKIAAITETVNLALKVSGATAAESSSAMLQLSQAFASGKLSGEEFNAVNEAAPRLMKALADGLGSPVGALKEMATEGKLTSAVLADSLPRALAELRKEAEAVQTISGAFQLLKNEVMQFVGTQAQASGAVNVMTGGIKLLAENLGLLAGVGLTLGASKLAQWLAEQTAETFKSVGASQAKAAAALMVAKADATATAASAALATARVAELRNAVLAAEGNVALAIATNGLIPAQARATVAAEAHAAALAAQTAAQKAASITANAAIGVLGFLGGPIGLITTLLGLGATAWGIWGSRAKEESTKAADSVKDNSERIIKALDEEIKRNERLIDLRKQGATVEQANKNESRIKQIADENELIRQIESGSGKYAQMNSTEKFFEREAAMGRLLKIAQDTQKAMSTGAQVSAGTQAEAVAEFWKDYATNTQKAVAEIEKRKKVLGDAFTPEMEAAIREKYAEKTPRSSGGSKGKTEAEKAGEDAAKFIAKLKEEAAQIGLATDQVKMMTAAREAAKAPTAGLRLEIMQSALALDLATKAHEAKTEAEKIAAGNEAQSVASAQQKIAAEYETVESLQREIETYDMLPAAITRAEIAKLEMLKSTLEANEGTAEEIRLAQNLIDVKKRQAGLQDAKTELDKQKENVAELKKIQDNFVENVQRNLGSGLFDMMNGGLKGIGDSFKKMLLQMVADAAAANIAAALFGNPKQSGSTGILSGALTAGLGFLGIAGARAAGGHVNSGSTYLVGEEGPEWFKSSSSGTIVPNHELQGGSAGPNVIVNQTNYIDSRTDQGAIAQIMQQTKNQTKAEIQREMKSSRTAYSR